MAAVHVEDICASFPCVGDLSGHHQEWFGSITTVMELQLLTSQLSPVAISWLSAQPMNMVEHDLLMTDVPDLVQVAVVAPIGNSDHSSLSVIAMAEAFLNLC